MVYELLALDSAKAGSLAVILGWEERKMIDGAGRVRDACRVIMCVPGGIHIVSRSTVQGRTRQAADR